MKFHNPIIPGCAPDPSIVLVRDVYYLVNSSFHLFPGLPIYTSRDLQSWTLLTHALSRPTQLSLHNAWMMHIKIPQPSDLIITGGLFAPTIRYHNSVFYIVCTNAVEDPDTKEHRFHNFLISCPEAEIGNQDSWSDPIYFEFPGIDPSLFFDGDRAYIQGSYREGPPWAPNCSIRQFEIDPRTGEALSETKLLWKGARPQGHAEGPHLYHKDGWYYLLTAEGSTFEGHEINIARSRDIWGPYESYESNPLLTALNTTEEVQWTGHGDLFKDKDGQWWCVHLGVRWIKGGPSPMGRETFLTPVSWEAGSWPKLSQTKIEFERCSTESLSPNDRPRIEAAPGLEDLFIRTPDLSMYKLIAPDCYELRPNTSSMSTPYGSTTFVGRRQRSLRCSAVVELDLASLAYGGTCAGVAVYKDSLRHAEIFVQASTRHILFDVTSLGHNETKQCLMTETAQVPKAGVIALKIEAAEHQYIFSWLIRGTQGDNEMSAWNQHATIDATALCGHDMTGVLFGIFASTTDPDRTQHCEVSFANFEIKSE